MVWFLLHLNHQTAGGMLRPADLAGSRFEAGQFSAGIAAAHDLNWSLLAHSHNAFFSEGFLIPQAKATALATLVHDTTVCAFRDRVAGRNYSLEAIRLFTHLNQYLDRVDAASCPNVVRQQCIILANLGDEYRRMRNYLQADTCFEKALFVAEAVGMPVAAAIVELMHQVLDLSIEPLPETEYENLLKTAQMLVNAGQSVGSYIPQLVTAMYLFVSRGDGTQFAGAALSPSRADFLAELQATRDRHELSALWRGVFVPFFADHDQG